MPFSTDAMKAPRADASPLYKARQALRQQVAERVRARPKAMSRWALAAWAAASDFGLMIAVSLAAAAIGSYLHGASIQQEFLALGLIGVALIGMLRLFGGYTFAAMTQPAKRLTALTGAMVFIAAGSMAAGHFAGADPAMAALIGPWALTVTAALIARGAVFQSAYENLRTSGRLAPTVVVVGATNIAERLIEDARAGQHQPFEIVGIFDDRMSRVQSTVARLPVLGTTDDLLKFEAIDNVDWIVIALPWAAERRIADILGRLRTVSTRILLAPDMVGLRFSDIMGDAHEGVPLVEVLGRPMDGGRRFAKEIEDRVLGTILTLAFAPVMLAIGLMVKLDSPGPAMFKQRRIGYSGKAFDVYKFRTLRTDMADAVAARQVTEDDPRVTRMGYYLRKFSLDELPQLINVVRGEMSLIGPRPYATGMMAGNTFAQDILVEYARRRQLKPGMTGWSQVNGGHGAIRSEADLRTRLEHDLDYINNWSLLFDAMILWKTAHVVLSGRKKPVTAAEMPAQPDMQDRIARATRGTRRAA